VCGPLRTAADVKATVEQGVAVLKSRSVCVIDFHIVPGEERQAGASIGQRATGE
jgi:hypothetical protein